MRTLVTQPLYGSNIDLDLPSTLPFWGIWMASESFPTLVAAYRLGLFDLLDQGEQTLEQIQTRLELTPRAARVLVDQLASLRLIAPNRVTNCYRNGIAASRYLTRRSESPKWHNRMMEMMLQDVTPARYLAFLERSVPHRYRYQIEAVDETSLCRIADDRFRLPILICADRLGLLASIGNNPGSSTPALGARLGIEPEYVGEMLRVLSQSGLLEGRPGGWSLSALAETYALTDADHPYHWGGIFTLMGQSPATPTSLLEAINKERSIKNGHQAPMMEHVMSYDLAQTFANHMHSQGAAAALAVAQHPAFATAQRVLDVAGGGGTYSFELCAAHPELRATVLEVHPMEEFTRSWIRDRQLKGRIDVARGDMFDAASWPDGHDTVFFSHVLHDWGADKIETLLRNAHRALPSGGKLVLHEILLGERHHHVAAAFSVTLYKWTEGRQYGANELFALLRYAGFEVNEQDVHELDGQPSSLIVATRR